MLKSFIGQKYYEADKENNVASGASTGNDPDKTEDKTFTQADVDAIVKTRLEREQRKSAEAADAAKKAAEQEALTKNGEYKTLAEQRASELAEANVKLEAAKTHEATAEKYRAALKVRLAADKKALPAHIVSLLDNLDEIKQMEWLSDPKNTEALKTTPVVNNDKKLGSPNRSDKPIQPTNTGAVVDNNTRTRFTLG